MSGTFLGVIGEAFFTIIQSAIKTGGLVISYFLDALLKFLGFMSTASPIEKVVGIIIFFVVTIIIFKFIIQSIKSLIWFLIVLGLLVVVASLL